MYYVYIIADRLSINHLRVDTLSYQAFRPPDEVTQERLQKAEVEQLEAWIDRVLDAESIDEVFQ